MRERERQREIIVKFTSYRTKALIFANKTKLKGNPDKTFITEDLTAHNHSVIKSLLELKKAKQIDSFWTVNGNVLAKTTHESSPIRLRFTDDIPKKLGIRRQDV